MLRYIAVLVICLLPWTHALSIWTTRIVEPPLIDLMDLVRQAEHFRYTDDGLRLTAIKDKKIQSCFVNDYDPYWQLYRDDKESIIASQEYQRYETDEELQHLKKKAGPVIANMCLLARIYWLNNAPIPPKLDPVIGQPPLDPVIGQPPQSPPQQNIAPPQQPERPPFVLPDQPNKMPLVDERPLLPDSRSGALLEPPRIDGAPSGEMIPPPKIQAPPRIVQEGGDLLIEPPRMNSNSVNNEMNVPPTIAPKLQNFRPDTVERLDPQAPPHQDAKTNEIIEPPRMNMEHDLSKKEARSQPYLVPPPPDMRAPKMPIH